MAVMRRTSSSKTTDQQGGDPAEERHGIADRPGGSFLSPAPTACAMVTVVPMARPTKHHGEHVHDLRADGDGGRRRDGLKLADDEKIRHAVERLQEVGKKIGKGKADDIFERRCRSLNSAAWREPPW